MRTEQKIIGLDAYEEGAVLEALKDLHNKKLAEEKPIDFPDELIRKVVYAQTRKARVRDEAR